MKEINKKKKRGFVNVSSAQDWIDIIFGTLLIVHFFDVFTR